MSEIWVKPVRSDILSKSMMTKERAQYVLSRPGPFGTLIYSFEHEFMTGSNIRIDGITELEDNYIKMIWSMMDGSTSYYDVVVKIAGGI